MVWLLCCRIDKFRKSLSLRSFVNILILLVLYHTTPHCLFCQRRFMKILLRRNIRWKKFVYMNRTCCFLVRNASIHIHDMDGNRYLELDVHQQRRYLVGKICVHISLSRLLVCRGVQVDIDSHWLLRSLLLPFRNTYHSTRNIFYTLLIYTLPFLLFAYLWFMLCFVWLMSCLVLCVLSAVASTCQLCVHCCRLYHKFMFAASIMLSGIVFRIFLTSHSIIYSWFHTNGQNIRI